MSFNQFHHVGLTFYFWVVSCFNAIVPYICSIWILNRSLFLYGDEINNTGGTDGEGTSNPSIIPKQFPKRLHEQITAKGIGARLREFHKFNITLLSLSDYILYTNIEPEKIAVANRANKKQFSIFFVSYPNMTTLRSCICRLNSVCLSVVCRLPSSSVTFVHPTQPVKIFRNVSMPFGSVAIQ